MPEQEGIPIKVTVKDNRRANRLEHRGPGEVRDPLRSDSPRTSEEQGSSDVLRNSPGVGTSSSPDAADSVDSPQQQGQDYLGDLQRVQAEFDNYRKRIMKEQTQIAERATQRLVERLLPVLDNFELAISHGEGGSGVELVYKELVATLQQEGLEEIPAEGVAFDPRVHEAVESTEDPDLAEPICRSVYRRGYRLRGALLRPAMVAVARPPEGQAPEEAQAPEDQVETG